MDCCAYGVMLLQWDVFSPKRDSLMWGVYPYTRRYPYTATHLIATILRFILQTIFEGYYKHRSITAYEVHCLVRSPPVLAAVKFNLFTMRLDTMKPDVSSLSFWRMILVAATTTSPSYSVNPTCYSQP